MENDAIAHTTHREIVYQTPQSDGEWLQVDKDQDCDDVESTSIQSALNARNVLHPLPPADADKLIRPLRMRYVLDWKSRYGRRLVGVLNRFDRRFGARIKNIMRLLRWI